MVLYNCPIWGIMLIVNRPLINSNNDKEHYEELVNRQRKKWQEQWYFQKSCFFFNRVYCSVQHEDDGLWTQGSRVGRGDHNFNDRSYMIHITDRLNSHKKQETHKRNTHNSRTIPLRLIEQKHCRHNRWHPKTLWKKKTDPNKGNTYSQKVNRGRHTSGHYEWHTAKGYWQK